MAYNIADIFEHTVDAVPDRLALVDGDTRLTFQELDERANRVAHALRDRGVKPGDHVGVYAQNCHECIETMYGAVEARAIPINIDFRDGEDELAYLLGNADCVAVVFAREYAPRLAAVRDRTETVHTFIWIDDGTDTDLAGLPAESFDEV